MTRIALPIYDEKKCALFALGRNAMYAACLSMKISHGDEVLTPAFDCDGSLQPFRVLGCELVLYRSDPHTFAADVADLRKRISPKTRLIHVINHFGMPQPWDELLVLRQETGIPILEDDAYSLFSQYRGRMFGTFGDMAIFSLRKNLPLVDGGMLRINNPRYAFDAPRRKVPFIYPTEVGALLNILKMRAGFYKLPAALKYIVKRLSPSTEPPVPLYSDSAGEFPHWPARDTVGPEFTRDFLRPMSNLAKKQLASFSISDFDDIAQKKLAFYEWLVRELRGIAGVTVLWPELDEGIVPFCVSILVESKRDLIFERLRKKYDVMVWPTLPGAVLRRLHEFPEVELLGRRLLQINLTADKVRSKGFKTYLGSLIRDLRAVIDEKMGQDVSCKS